VTERSPTQEDLRCIEFSEVVTDYLDGAVDEDRRRSIERHLAGCTGCRAALDQFRTVVDISGRLTATDVASIDPLLRDRLAATLRLPRRK
jgi:anti-sigma factor RsiW